MACQSGDQLSSAGIPNPCRIVIRRCDHLLSIRTERRGQYSLIVVQYGNGLGTVGVPDTSRVVRRRRDNLLSVRAKSAAEQNMCRSLLVQRRNRRAGLTVPDVARGSDGQHTMAVRAEDGTPNVTFLLADGVFEEFLAGFYVPNPRRPIV